MHLMHLLQSLGYHPLSHRHGHRLGHRHWYGLCHWHGTIDLLPHSRHRLVCLDQLFVGQGEQDEDDDGTGGASNQTNGEALGFVAVARARHPESGGALPLIPTRLVRWFADHGGRDRPS